MKISDSIRAPKRPYAFENCAGERATIRMVHFALDARPYAIALIFELDNVREMFFDRRWPGLGRRAASKGAARRCLEM
jgi:hypothetical protein